MTFLEFLKNRNFKDITEEDHLIFKVYSFSNDEKNYTCICKEDLIDNQEGSLKLEFELTDVITNDGKDIDFVFCSLFGRFFYCDQIIDEKYIVNVEREFDLIGCKNKTQRRFVYLNNSIYGLSKGRNINEFINFVYTRNFSGVGICDDNLIASLKFYKDVKEKFNVIFGRRFKTEYGTICLYAKNYDGFQDLMYLNYYVSLLKSKGEEEVLILKILKKYSKNIVCIIETFENFVVNKNSLKVFYNSLVDVFRHLYIGFEYYNNKRINRTKRLYRLIKKYGLIDKVVYFNLSAYTFPTEEKSFQAITKLTDESFISSRDLSNRNYKEIFDELKVLLDNDKQFIVTALSNTNYINRICNVKIPLGHYDLPSYEYKGDKKELFEKIINEGIEKKLRKFFKKGILNEKVYMDRIEYEKSVIYEANFIDYFLIIWGIVKWVKDNDIYAGVARGSVAGSLVAFVMDITGVDPIKFDLLFERFLNKARLTGERAKAGDALPDIDMDFESGKRNDIKNYIIKKYGQSSSCSIGTYGKLQVRAAIKDIGKLFGLSFQYCNYITKRIRGNEFSSLIESACKNSDVFSFIRENPDLLSVIMNLLTLPKNASIHPAGMIIVPKGKKLWSYVPVKYLEDGTSENGYSLVSEWEGKYIDARGILKIDVLGIKQLDVFRDIEDLIKKRYDTDVSLDFVIQNDLHNKKVYKEFAKGTEGVFQFKSPGLKSYMKYMKPSDFEDLVAANALYRPGAMSSSSHLKYVKIKNGEEEVEYDHELLKPVTKKTYGLYIYQEQIMQAVVALGKLSMEEADVIRTTIKKFDREKMKQFEEKFIKGARENGCSKEEAENIWKKLLAFSGYGFNKSHSCSYSMLGYYCQWLKVHYPLEFFTVNLNYAVEDEISSFILKLKDFGITYKLPNINFSAVNFKGYKKSKTIYWALKKIKGVGIKAAMEINEKRNKVGLFKNLKHFLDSVKKQLVNKRVVEALIYAGAFDELYDIKKPKDRKKIFDEYYVIRKEEKVMDESYDNYYYEIRQKELLGISDIVNFKRIAKELKVEFDIMETILLYPQGHSVDFMGMIVGRKIFTTKKGYEMMVLNCEHNGVSMDLVIFPRSFDDLSDEQKESLQVGNVVFCEAKIGFDDFKKKENLIYNTRLKIKKFI